MAPHRTHEPNALLASLDSLREGLQVISPEWRYVYVNDATARQGRKARAELVGRRMMDCYPGIEATELFSVLERCMRQRERAELETEFEFEGGTRGWFELRIEPCREGLIVLSVEITERKRMERALLEAHKLRALGQMASGVAHDLKNILNPLGLQVEVLKRKLRSDPAALEVLEQMASVLRRGTETIDLLRDFGRQSSEAPAHDVDLSSIAREAIALCRPRAQGVLVQDDLTDAISVRVAGAEVLSAVVNLLVNAIEAMQHGGRVTVRTGREERFAWLAVEDDGPGMPPEVEARAFEPFFSTKGEAGGGLGLAIVYAVAARNRGEVQLRTAPAAGTTVTLRFPADAAPEQS